MSTQTMLWASSTPVFSVDQASYLANRSPVDLQSNGQGYHQPRTMPSEAGSSSKASSPIETAKVDWQFLNFTHPSEAKTSQHRKKVRSHVTKQQHQREQALTAARRTQSYQAETESEEPPPQRAHAATTPSNRPTLSEITGDHAQMSIRSPRSKSPSASPSPTSYSPQHRIDLNDIYPEEWHPYVERILKHYLTNIAIDNPDLDGPDATGLLRTHFFPFVLTDPAPVHAVMLVAASHFGRVRGSKSHTIDLLQLRGMAISEINRALADESRGTSDQLIAAVAEMASYEALFGDRSICNTHMQGLTRMVSLRGGLPALGLDGLLERLILWVDSNTSHITGNRLYFDKSAFPPSSAGVTHPRPDPTRFTAGGLSRRPSG